MWILQSDSLREEVSYKDSELMEQCNTDKTPNNPHVRLQNFTLWYVRFQVKKNKEYSEIKQGQQ